MTSNTYNQQQFGGSAGGLKNSDTSAGGGTTSHPRWGNLIPKPARFNFTTSLGTFTNSLGSHANSSISTISADGSVVAVPTRLNNLQNTFRNLMGGSTSTGGGGSNKRKSLPANYAPSDKDVCCGRGKRNWNHAGNVHFRNIIRNNVQRYQAAPSKHDKTMVVVSIVEQIRGEGGRFLKEDARSGKFFDIGDAQAREKVGHSLCDQVTAMARQQTKKQVIAVPQTTTATAAAVPEILHVVERRPSIHSESGQVEDVDPEQEKVRRSSDIIKATFARRPSFVAFSMSSKDSASKRASTLMGGDEIAQHMNHLRRTSNWDFMDDEDLLDILDQLPPEEDFKNLIHNSLNSATLVGLSGSLPSRKNDKIRSSTSSAMSFDDMPLPLSAPEMGTSTAGELPSFRSSMGPYDDHPIPLSPTPIGAGSGPPPELSESQSSLMIKNFAGL